MAKLNAKAAKSQRWIPSSIGSLRSWRRTSGRSKLR
jgi:hypothetical protein